MGRSKLTPGIKTAIVQAVAEGVPLIQAAALAGIDRATVWEWLARGAGTHPRPRTPLYANFADAIACARCADEATRIARISQAAQGGAVLYTKTTETVDADGNVTRRVIEERRSEPSWQADAFVLERAFSERWGRKDRVDLTLTIQRAAQQVADELGLTAEEVIREAEHLLRKVDAHVHAHDT